MAGDFDGDGKRDPAVYRPATGTWFWLKSSSNYTQYEYRGWGLPGMGDVPVPGDYDRDGKTDPTVYRPQDGTWFILKSSSSYKLYSAPGWGTATDVPAPADFDGDGLTDVAVYRPATGEWIVRAPGGGSTLKVVFGQAGDVPLVVR